MQCRAGCGACCVAPSISSPIPGMPEGKPAGVACVQLDEQALCRLFDHRSRPQVCLGFQAGEEYCGENVEQAMNRLSWLEQATGD